MALLNDPSSMTIKTKLSDGIRSTRAFMTSVTPANKGTDSPEKNDGPNLNFAENTLNTNSATKLGLGNKSQRKVFGAQDYLER